MGLFSRNDKEESRAVTYADVWGKDLSATSATTAGVAITDDSAMKLSTVYGAVRILTDGVATLPISLTKGKGGDSRPVARVPAWVEEPSLSIRKIDFMSQIMMSLLFRGDAFVATYRDDVGKVLELKVIDPDLVTVQKTPTGIVYTAGGTVLGPREILHIRGLVKPGEVEGISPLTYAAETIGLGLAAQQYGASFFKNGAVPAAIVSTPGKLSSEGVNLLKNSWNNVHKGSDKSGKLAVLTEGAEFKPLSVSPDEAQFLQTRAFQVADIARIYAVPPHLLQDASGSTSWGSGLAEQSQNYVTHSLRPWVERIEEALTWLARSEVAVATPKNRLYVSLRMDHLLRGDYSTRIATYGSALDRGIYNLDEVRAFEGLPPLPDGLGQEHRVPLNTAATDAEPQEAPEEPALPADSEESPNDE